MSYQVAVYPSPAITASTTVVVTPMVDVHEYEQLCISIENSLTAATLVHVLVEASLNADTSTSPPGWFAINTSTYPYASAVGATAIIGFTISPNPFRYLRVSVRTTITANASVITTRVGQKEDR